jgi:hypothetical protein
VLKTLSSKYLANSDKISVSVLISDQCYVLQYCTLVGMVKTSHAWPPDCPFKS